MYVQGRVSSERLKSQGREGDGGTRGKGLVRLRRKERRGRRRLGEEEELGKGRDKRYRLAGMKEEGWKEK